MALANVCHGCLAVDRKLSPLKEHVTLYHRLLLTKIKDQTKKIQIKMCWECQKILSNIHMFRMKVTHAQRLLNNNSWKNNSLSNLTKSHTENNQIIIYEDEKPYTVPMEFDNGVKNEKDNNQSGFHEVETEIAIKIEKDEDANFDDRNSFDDVDYKKNIFHDIDSKQFKPSELIPKKILVKAKGEVKVEPHRKRGGANQKYRTIVIADIVDKRKFYDVEKIDQKTVEKWVQWKKMKTSTRNFQCSMCYSGFKQQKVYERHMAVRHNEKHDYACDICGFRFARLSRLRGHVHVHYQQFRCAACARAYSSRDQVYAHLACEHRRRLECTRCGATFHGNKIRSFYEHYRNAHGTRKICDYCGSGFGTKTRLARHIKIRHTDSICKICNSKFSSHDALKIHHERKHVVEKSERNYCVECGIQFNNSRLYNDHITRSTKHTVKPRIPCPECDRTYTKRSYMMNHYNLEHSKKSKNICPICNRMFLNGFRLRRHIAYTHEKQPKPRNHICIYCGKGFNTRLILENHVRTHTGERPFACEQCSAAFTQKQALVAHKRSAHK